MMTKVTVKKTGSGQSQTQDFSYAPDATLSHIKKHLAREMAYLKKGSENIFTKGQANDPSIKLELVEATGLNSEDKSALSKFVATL